MGAFADAFGMSQLSIATLAGFYSTEVGTIHSLGGAMFAAIISTVMLSKEEDGHTSKFLFTLPIAREKVITSKLLAILSNVVMFNVISVGAYFLGIVMIFYDFDLMARMIPDLKEYKLLTPFSYSNAADIFSTGNVDDTALVLGMVAMVLGTVAAYVRYGKRDLAS